MERIFNRRNWFALGGAVLASMLAALSALWSPMAPERASEGEVMHVSLAAPPQPVLAPAPPQAQQPQPSPSPRTAAPQAPPTPSAPAAPAAPAAPVAPNVPVAPSAPPPNSAQIENAYATSVRARIEQEKVYPTSRDARIQHPQGTVECWFVLNRSGALVDAGVSRSAGSILDRQALVTIRRGRYAPFPDDAWRGESQHRFTVELEFRMS